MRLKSSNVTINAMIPRQGYGERDRRKAKGPGPGAGSARFTRRCAAEERRTCARTLRAMWCLMECTHGATRRCMWGCTMCDRQAGRAEKQRSCLYLTASGGGRQMPRHARHIAWGATGATTGTGGQASAYAARNALKRTPQFAPLHGNALPSPSDTAVLALKLAALGFSAMNLRTASVNCCERASGGRQKYCPTRGPVVPPIASIVLNTPSAAPSI